MYMATTFPGLFPSSWVTSRKKGTGNEVANQNDLSAVIFKIANGESANGEQGTGSGNL